MFDNRFDSKAVQNVTLNQNVRRQFVCQHHLNIVDFRVIQPNQFHPIVANRQMHVPLEVAR